jgi:RNA polymerase sigma-70 factor (ECF subfamily)
MPGMDPKLIEDAQKGDARALQALMEEHYPALRAFIRLRVDEGLRVKESSSDLVQSVCRDVLAGLQRFHYRGEGSFKAWLFKAALNKIREKHAFYHAQKRDVGLEVKLSGSADLDRLAACYATLSPSRAAAAEETARRLEAAFALLPEDYREVLTLARIVGLSHNEIAEQMGRTVAASRVLLSRALARLASLLKQSDSQRDTD